MNQPRARKKTNLISQSRWVTYATASAATAFAGLGNAEADIHHVDVNKSFAPVAGSSTISVFALAPGAQFSLRAFLHTSGVNGHASFGIFASGGTAAFVGYSLGSGSIYASKLAAGQTIVGKNFVTNGGYFRYIERHNTGQFGAPGIGFIGFKFNTGAGVQYGWARVNMGGARLNQYSLVDYAWGDVGDQIVAGQTAAVPEPGSLGLLAAGGAALLVWRKRRSVAGSD